MPQIPEEAKAKLLAHAQQQQQTAAAVAPNNDAVLRMMSDQSGRMDLPGITTTAYMFLQEINSPFAPSEVQRDPTTGNMVLDAEGKPIPVVRVPKMRDIVEAVYILKHSRDPRLWNQIRSENWSQTVMQFANQYTIAELMTLLKTITERVGALDKSMSALGDGGAEGNAATGPTASLPESSLSDGQADPTT